MTKINITVQDEIKMINMYKIDRTKCDDIAKKFGITFRRLKKIFKKNNVEKNATIPWNVGKKMPKRTPEQCKAISERLMGEKHPMYGKHYPEAHCRKLSEKFKKMYAEGTRKSWNKGKFGYTTKLKGYHHTPEAKSKMSNALKIIRKGKRPSQETINKSIEAHKGKPLSEEHKLKIKNALSQGYKSGRLVPSFRKSGKDHHNWKGGITPLSNKRTGSKKWIKIADRIRQRDGNHCRICNKTDPIKKLPVHHIIPYRISKDDSEQNLITLCVHCHREFELKINDLGYRTLLQRKVLEVIPSDGN